MSIRITQGMMYARALTDVQSGLYRYTQLQQEVASGRRISRPSDDPAASLRILPLRGDLRDLRQLSDNVQLARETLNTGASSLEDASTVLQRVRELTTQAANGTLNGNDRKSIGAEIDQLLGQVLGIANSRRGDRYLFGGTANGEPPFSLDTSNGRTRPTYNGNRDSLNIDVAPGVSTALNLPGDSIFMQRDRGATSFFTTTDALPTGAQPAGVGDTGVGYASLQVSFGGLTVDAPATVTTGSGSQSAVGPLDYVFTSGPDTLSIGGGPPVGIPATDQTFNTLDGRSLTLTVTGVPATTAGTFTASADLTLDNGETITNVTDFSNNSIAVNNSDDASVLYVNTENLTQIGTDEVRYNGTFDVFTTLAELRNLLQNDEGLSDSTVRDLIGSLLPEVEDAHNAVLDGLRELGFRSSSMDVLQNRVEGLHISRTESLSLVQDTDIAAAILEFQRQDLSYQTALQVSARVLQTSLQGFLR
ncbi:MAG: flagellin-like hook-associated protein FlgL [Planctomycetota bacterium]|jgi:flagellin-like hook-associated protein FlgL